MAQASHRADRSPVLSSTTPPSCLISSSSSPLALLSSLPSAVHRCPCSAQLFGTFRVTVSRLLYHLRATIKHLGSDTWCAHHTHHLTDTLPLSIDNVNFPPEESRDYQNPSSPPWWNSSSSITLTAESFSFLLFESISHPSGRFETFLIKQNKKSIYIHTRKWSINKNIFVQSTFKYRLVHRVGSPSALALV